MCLNQTSVCKVMTIWISRELLLFNWASRYLMWLNQTSEWKVMTILISPEFPLFNNQCLDILCTWITHLRESYDHSNFSSASVVQFRASRHVMCLNRNFVCKVMTILISQELPLFNFERLDIWCAWIGPPCEKLWPFEFLKSFRCSISRVSIYDAPESDLRVKSYDHLNFSRASGVQFRESRYMMRLNRTTVWKVMTIWISRYPPLFNFERLHMWCAWIGPPCAKLWPFEFLESFRCSISSVSICDVPESEIRVKSNDNFNFSGVSIVQ